jgi:hypothetical protein
MPNEFRLRLPEKAPSCSRLATMYVEQAYVPKEVRYSTILSINRVHEVFGHFYSSVLDKMSVCVR